MKASHRLDRRSTSGPGGYDDGYAACPCFWGKQPSSLVSFHLSRHEMPEGCRVLDAGCGDGRNAQAFARRGANVLAIDISRLAIERARAAWPEISVNWCQTDIREAEFETCSFDVIVAYGILHCLRGPKEIAETIAKFRATTNVGGYNIVCAFNERHQELGRALFFIGYSFRDPNVAYLFRLVTDRFKELPGSFSGRRAYIIVSNPSDFEMQLFNQRGIEVIPAVGEDRVSTYAEIIEDLAS